MRFLLLILLWLEAVSGFGIFALASAFVELATSSGLGLFAACWLRHLLSL
jgi:hypothetical protein